MATKFYPLGDNAPCELLKAVAAVTGEKRSDISGYHRVQTKHVRAVRTGEFRAPKKGEWYLSGAEPTAYKAPNDLSSKYHILKLVRVQETVVHTIHEIEA